MVIEIRGIQRGVGIGEQRELQESEGRVVDRHDCPAISGKVDVLRCPVPSVQVSVGGLPAHSAVRIELHGGGIFGGVSGTRCP